MAKKPRSEPAGKAEKVDVSKLAAGAGINMDDAQESALFFQDKAKHEKLLAAQKLANKAVMDHGKVIAKHFGDAGLPVIKLAIKLDKGDPEVEKDIKAEMELRLRMMRWKGLTVGAQPSLFGEDRRPADEIAFDAGVLAGMEGKSQKDFGYDESNPHWQEAARGWHEGQARIFNIKPLGVDDDGQPTLLKGRKPKPKAEPEKPAAETGEEVGEDGPLAQAIADEVAGDMEDGTDPQDIDNALEHAGGPIDADPDLDPDGSTDFSSRDDIGDARL